MKNIAIAVDGYVAAGKGTLASAIAKKYNCWNMFIQNYKLGNLYFENVKIKNISKEVLKNIILRS